MTDKNNRYYKKNIVPLYDLIQEVINAKESSIASETDNLLCDCCNKRILGADEYYKVADNLDCCVVCKAMCDDCDTVSKHEMLARKLFDDDVKNNISYARFGWSILGPSPCDGEGCTVSVDMGAKLTGMLGNQLTYCDKCLKELRDKYCE